MMFILQANEELKLQISAQQKTIEQQKSHINKCIDVVKKLLIEKSTIEKKEARQRCMQNRLRLGQFVTQRVGAQFQENWTDGHAFQELTRYVARNHFGKTEDNLLICDYYCVLFFLGDKKRSQPNARKSTARKNFS